MDQAEVPTLDCEFTAPSHHFREVTKMVGITVRDPFSDVTVSRGAR